MRARGRHLPAWAACALVCAAVAGCGSGGKTRTARTVDGAAAPSAVIGAKTASYPPADPVTVVSCASPRGGSYCTDASGLRHRNHWTQREFVMKQIQEDDVMTRSVEELRRESERSRAELAATVDQLRERISDTAEDIRHKVSPQHIKSEVSDYVSHKTQSWVEAIKQRAMENPMQAIAASTAVAVPVLRLARGSSLPLLMIGAGLALTSKTVRDPRRGGGGSRDGQGKRDD